MEKTLKAATFGSVKPTGWLFEKMRRDLEEGYVGYLDQLVPDLILNDDIYGSNRLTNKVKTKSVGNLRESHEQTVTDEAGDEILTDWEAQYLWWNSETQSNWRDGFLRHALLVENKEFLEKARVYVEEKLSTQDEDGYLGIYDEDLRFNFDSENGELWAQATLLRGLLGYYEATKEERVLKAVIAAVEVTMNAYKIYESTPFKAQDEFAGLTHGLMFVDIVGQLYELTGEKRYLDYAVFLYEDYNAHPLCEEDSHVKNILNPSYEFKGHGPHTYEHLRALIYAAYDSENPIYKEALETYMTRLERLTCPSGGPIGDEWIGKMNADASMTGYEYCSTHELLHAYALLLQKSKNLSVADKIEWLYYNAALGAMHPDKSTIAYLKSDNSYDMSGVFQTEQPHCVHGIQVRYKYSPTHQDAAVCCVPNAGRITPYFMNSFYFESESEIVAALFGPSSYETMRQETPVTIVQETTYPSNFDINFKITAEQPVSFNFVIRRPKWAKSVNVEASGLEVSVETDCVIVSGTFVNNVINVSFEAEVCKHQDLLGDVYFSYGPLVYALPIKGEEVIQKTYDFAPFNDFYVVPQEEIPAPIVTEDAVMSLLAVNAESLVEAPLLSVKTNEEELMLTPMANTILRRVTFNVKGE